MIENYSTKEKNHSIADYIAKFGNHSSIALLDPCYTIFNIPDIYRIIGYRVESNCAILFGDPLCPPQNIPLLAHAFHDFCFKQKKM